MPTRDVFSEQHLARLRGFPGIAAEDMIEFFTLSSADETFVRSPRGVTVTLGRAMQPRTLPWLGFVPDEVAAAPRAVVTRLADRLGLEAGEPVGYGALEQIRTDHLHEILRYRGWRTAHELVLGKLAAEDLPIEVAEIHTDTTDQHAVFGTKVILAADRAAPFVLDEILGNKTDVPITEHATHTHDASLITFALFDLGGSLSPRMRHLGKLTTLTRTADPDGHRPLRRPVASRTER